MLFGFGLFGMYKAAVGGLWSICEIKWAAHGLKELKVAHLI